MDMIELIPGIDLLQSMRSVGYSFEAAVADVVDNSISAGATRIEILVDVVDGEFVSIRDDGHGMAQDEAMEALRLAGTARMGTETTHSLGRFGLGLKTASLSQGRRVEVVSRKRGATTALAWDIDLVAESQKWVIDMLSPERVDALMPIHRPIDGQDGTVVRWTKLDYLTGHARDIPAHLSPKVATLREHLGRVFHRYIEEKGGLVIILNGSAVKASDPFLESHPKTQHSPQQTIVVEGSPVTLKGFTLPHAKDIPVALRNRSDLGEGMRESQGFYVYRNRRLISQGGWFGLRPKEELTKQARVRVDISDTLDFLWQIDIRKTRSEPPSQFRTAVRPVMDRLVQRSKRVHTFRGRTTEPADYARLWEKIEDRDGARYAVNAEHPIVARVKESLPRPEGALFHELLRELAECFPYYDTYISTARNQLAEFQQPDNDDTLRRLRALKSGGFARDDVKEMLLGTELFHSYSNLDELITEAWSDADR